MPTTVAAIPAYVAREKGFWAAEGLNVEVQMFTAGRLALDALLSGHAQVMSVSETPLVQAILQGHSIYIVSTVTGHQETKFVGRRDRGIALASDLKGKTVATLPGTNSDYFMYRVLEANRVSPENLHIVSLQPPNMVSALARGRYRRLLRLGALHILWGERELSQNSVIIGPDDLYHGRHCIAMMQDFVKNNPGGSCQAAAWLRQGGRVHTSACFAAFRPSSRNAHEARGNWRTQDAFWQEYDVKDELGQDLLDILRSESQLDLEKQGGAAPGPGRPSSTQPDCWAWRLHP